MADNRGFRDSKTGRFARRSVPDLDAESKFDPMADSIEDIEDVSGAPSPSTIERPRYVPGADLAQGEQWSPLRARNPVLVHPDDEGHHNAIMRTAARNAGPMDSSPFLTGLVGSPGPSRGIGGTGVEVHGDHNPLSPVRSQDIAPGRPVGRVRDVSDDEPTGTPRGDLPPSSRGLGRARNR